VKCAPPIDLPETIEQKYEKLLKVNKLQGDEISALKSVGATTINNTNNTNNSNNTNNTININFNNYDKPNTDHITNQVMKGIYETSQRDPALILNETVRRIYLNDKHPENHVIKITDKAAYSKVYKDGKEISLPMGGVIQTVLSNTGEFCADRIRDCHEEGVIIGDRARYVWQLMEVLGTDDRDDDALNRSLYIQSIKSAFL
jgi:acetyl/propionyl-CoA carboxylase alpha subunit